MESQAKPSRALPTVVGLLGLSFAAALLLTLDFDEVRTGDLLPWLVLTALFFAAEYWDTYFHDERARLALSPSEAILFPILLGLTYTEAVLAVSVAISAERVLRRLGALKAIFNIASFGWGIVLAYGAWEMLRDGTADFTIVNAGAGLAGLVVFSLATHIFSSVVVSLAEGKNVWQLTQAIGPTTFYNVLGSAGLGLFLAASFSAARWTVFLFPAPVLGLYLANRALIRQRLERDRVESLHEASRALAAANSLRDALSGFLQAAARTVSAARVRAIVFTQDNMMTFSATADGTTEASDDLDVPVINELLDALGTSRGALTVSDDDTGSGRDLANRFGTSNFIATSLVQDGRPAGALIAAGRVGAGDFSEADVRLLEALGHELMLSIDSYRLFQEVADERERFARIFLGSKEGICLIDADGVVRAWNPTLERLTGYIASEVMGRVWSDVVMLRTKDQHRIEGAGLAEVDPDEEIELVSRDGPTRWVSVLAGPVQAEGGGWVVLLRDVTAQHEVEQAKSDFLSTISHELRTPLTTIKGSLQVLERNPENLPPELTRQMIGVTSRGAERLERLVMNLLIVSQIESGTMPLFTDELHLQDLVAERVGIVLREHENVVLNMPDGAVFVRADRERLAQALDHVFDNAIKFGGGGPIIVAVERANGYARVSVHDEGPGIPGPDRERIFDRFVRLGDVLTRETQGAGVGLFIARESMTAMNGEIWVESTPGKGSTFHLKLPMARPVEVLRSEAS